MRFFAELISADRWSTRRKIDVVTFDIGPPLRLFIELKFLKRTAQIKQLYIQWPWVLFSVVQNSLEVGKTGPQWHVTCHDREAMNEKRLIYVGLNSAGKSVANEVAALGWELQSLVDLKNADKILGELHFQVGVMSLIGCDTTRCTEIEDFLLSHRDGTAWVAVIDNAGLEMEACRRLILTFFDDYLVLPADPSVLSARLAHARIAMNYRQPFVRGLKCPTNR